jgi:hypothetical protein
MAQKVEEMVATEEAVSTQEPSLDPTDLAPEEIQKRIELRVSQSFFDAVKLLADTENISRADIIRKAVSLYARARIEQKKGNFVAFARMGSDNTVEVAEMLSVV